MRKAAIVFFSLIAIALSAPSAWGQSAHQRHLAHLRHLRATATLSAHQRHELHLAHLRHLRATATLSAHQRHELHLAHLRHLRTAANTPTLGVGGVGGIGVVDTGVLTTPFTPFGNVLTPMSLGRAAGTTGFFNSTFLGINSDVTALPDQPTFRFLP